MLLHRGKEAKHGLLFCLNGILKKDKNGKNLHEESRHALFLPTCLHPMHAVLIHIGEGQKMSKIISPTEIIREIITK